MKPYYTLADLLDEGHPFDAGESVPAKLAVIGFPIAHSKSPAMQQAALDAAGNLSDSGKKPADFQAKVTASGLLKGDGAGGVTAAAAGTDYSGPKATVTATLLASGWTGSEAPFVYTLAIAGVTATSYQELVPAVNITAEQLKALQAANITDGGQAAGSMTLKAYGKVPTVDIPIRVIKEGE